MKTPFKVYKQFNDAELQLYAGMKHRLHSLPSELFPTQSFPDRVAQALAAERVIHIKELVESFEFFYRVRKRLRAPELIDLCAGHGLAGLLFAACEERVEKVLLIDQRQPESFPRIWRAFEKVAPWVMQKVEYREEAIDADLELSPRASVILVHACGELTDKGLKRAIAHGAAVAAMPCCYGKALEAQVPGLAQHFGRNASIDISRSYLLANAGYQVDWSQIPEAVTPMNRIIVGWNRQEY
ncbi:MAG: methyltransferase [Polyangiaceae bacterium]|nr:methyltransferase [Polyangiaceae bacterium]